MSEVLFNHCIHCDDDGCDRLTLHGEPCGAEEDCPGAVPIGGAA
jgi:hypothetical protein